MKISLILVFFVFGSVTGFSQTELFDGKHTYRYESNGYQIETAAPRYSGDYYKIQIIVIAQFSKKDPALIELAKYGRVDYEYVIKKQQYRILLGDFWNKSKVDETIVKLKELGYSTAFSVRYKNGIRVNT